MEDFKIIYRILNAIIAYEKAEEKDLIRFSPEVLKTTAENRDRLITKLVKDGYVDGMTIISGIDNAPAPVILWHSSNPTITIKGMEYLEQNSMMQKAKHIARDIIDIAGHHI